MDALLLPNHLENVEYTFGSDTQPSVSASSSMSKDGTINITIVNIDPGNSFQLSCALDGMDVKKVTGTIISSEDITDHNTFENPDKVIIKDFKDIKVSKGKMDVILPSKSVVLLRIN